VKRIFLISLLLVSCIPFSSGQESIESLLHEGIEYHDAGKYPQAIAAYEKALRINPEAVEVIYEISLSLLENGNYYASIEYCDKLLDRDDKFAILAYNTKGSCLNYLGKPDEAIDIYLEGLQKEPEFYLTYYNLGLAYFAKGDYTDAAKAFVVCLDLNPEYAGAHLNLGRTMFQQNKRVQGLLCLYYFLLIEPESERSILAYDTLILHLNDPRTKEAEGESDPFASVDNQISRQALLIDSIAAHKNDVRKFTQQTESFFLSLSRWLNGTIPISFAIISGSRHIVFRKRGYLLIKAVFEVLIVGYNGNSLKVLHTIISIT